MVVGLGPLSWIGRPPSLALVDGDAGSVIFDPEPETRRLFERRMAAANAARAAADAGRARACLRTPTVGGSRFFSTLPAPEDLADLDPAICDGIGLVRTEFLFEASHGLPDEETQYRVYRRILDWAQGKPVTIRTLDAGGDKPIRRFDGRRREQSVSRPSRHPPLARAAGGVSRATAGAVPCGRAWDAESDAADDCGPVGIRPCERDA